MAAIPSNLARVPTMLSTQIMASAINGTNRQMLNLQTQLATGKAINRPSDSAAGTSAISVLEDVIERRDQRIRNLTHGEAVLGNVDAAIADASDMVIEAKGIASSQAGFGSDSTTRANQALVIDEMLNAITNVANRQFQDIFFFGGTQTATQPITSMLGGLQYNGQGDGLLTDLGLSSDLTISAAADDVFGALSARVEGTVDLDPSMRGTTRLADLNGARGLGVSLGSFNVNAGGTTFSVDLSTAHTVDDVVTMTHAARDAAGVAAGDFAIAVDASGMGYEVTAGVAVTVSDLSAPSTAADLGIAATYGVGTTAGADVDPKLLATTAIADLAGLGGALGTLRVTGGGQVRDVDLSTAVTVQDMVNSIDALQIGVRMEIADTGNTVNVINQLSGSQMTIEEVGGTTATELGIRSLSATTLLADFNDGRGVEIVSGNTDPVTGLPDPARDMDFEITTRGGTSFTVDLAGSSTVDDVLTKINAAAVAAGLGGGFSASLVTTGNGIQLNDTTGAGTLTVAKLNGSQAADHLGILGSTAGATLVGTDRAKVAVDSVFTHLISLRDALNANDELGIVLAGEKLEADVSRLAAARADAGVRTNRVLDARMREEDLRLQDIGLKAQVQDLDFTDAALRFATLQQQLQAGLTTASRALSLSLIDFIG